MFHLMFENYIVMRDHVIVIWIWISWYQLFTLFATCFIEIRVKWMHRRSLLQSVKLITKSESVCNKRSNLGYSNTFLFCQIYTTGEKYFIYAKGTYKVGRKGIVKVFITWPASSWIDNTLLRMAHSNLERFHSFWWTSSTLVNISLSFDVVYEIIALVFFPFDRKEKLWVHFKVYILVIMLDSYAGLWFKLVS